MATGGHAVRPPRRPSSPALLAGEGTLVGCAVAGLVALIRRRTKDPVLETVIVLLTPYAAYIPAEAVHASGVTSVVVAGCCWEAGRTGSPTPASGFSCTRSTAPSCSSWRASSSV
ncbi:cation:proton antiporter domain-containing protein [Streptomyces solincola]|uniref:cation:proton antiporter domain-containing protein n=1 Tax=Streptomyces solincola TaxID=2100817 RepID=UPI002AFDEF58|nr:cation:proton antiporter [Streptomyces solincola]